MKSVWNCISFDNGSGLRLLIVSWLLLTASHVDAQSYLFQMQSGKRIKGVSLAGWNKRVEAPVVDGQDLTNGGDRLRWYASRKLAGVEFPAAAGGFIEFAGGDRIPGRVLQYVQVETGSPEKLPAHLLLQCPIAMNRPGAAVSHEVRLLPAMVSRICFNTRCRRSHSPGNVFMRDGSQIAFRKLRWLVQGVQLLTTEGPRTLAFNDIEDLHMPLDSAAYNQLVVQRVKGDGERLAIKCGYGLIATAPAGSFQAMGHSKDEDRVRKLDQVAKLKDRIQDLQKRIVKVTGTHERRLVALKRRTQDAEKRTAAALKRIAGSRKGNTPEKAKKLEETARRMYASTVNKHLESAENYKKMHLRQLDNYKGQIKHLQAQLDDHNRTLDGDVESTDPDTWHHQIQPAWSMDPLWIKFSDITSRLLMLPGEVRLSSLWPTNVVQKSTFGKGLSYRTDTNVLHTELRSGGQAFGWGLGVHAHCELHFDLPEAATEFRTLVALDDVAAAGGCASAAVYLKTIEGNAIYESPLLHGERRVHDSGKLPLPEGDGPRRLILVVRQVDKQRPQGAAPFDIMDHVNWLEPVLRLSP